MLSRNLQLLVDRRGQPATLSKPGTPTYDPATGQNSFSGPSTYSIKAYFGEYTLEELNNDSVSLGDRRVLVPPRDTSGNLIPEPDSEDTITGVGDEVIIKAVQKIYNASTLECYICMVRE